MSRAQCEGHSEAAQSLDSSGSRTITSNHRNGGDQLYNLISAHLCGGLTSLDHRRSFPRTMMCTAVPLRDTPTLGLVLLPEAAGQCCWFLLAAQAFDSA